MTTYAQYKRTRAEYPTLPATRVVALLRYTNKPVLELDWKTDCAKFTHQGAEIVARWIPDYDAASDSRPQATDNAKSGIRNPDCVVTGTDDYGNVRLSAPKYLELESGETVAGLAAYYRRAGMARGPAWLTAQQETARHARQEMETNYSYCVVEVWANGVQLGDAALFGIGESDDYAEAIAYRADTVAELLSEAMDNARTKLDALRTVEIGATS